MRVSVIIPFYNVSKYIAACANSLLTQTFNDVEFIFVDDASPDDSRAILERVIASHPERNARIISHTVNKGLPAARNTGLQSATGDYIYHCDSDDLVAPDFLEKMCGAAEKNDADFVYCDFYITFEKSERYLHNPKYKTPEEMLKRGFLGGMAKYNVWNKLVRRSVYEENGISFPEGHAMGEDMTMIQLVSCSRSIAFIPEALYHYVKLNSSAYSNIFSERHLDDIRFNVDRTVTFLDSRFGAGTLQKEIAFFKLSIKFPFLITEDRDMYRIWKSWYPEANRYAMSNHDQPLRTRLLQWFASKDLFVFVRLYYSFVYKLVYGVIYK
ncbi:MAG: glycosyltransferase [Bacteroidales bacterium]|nr:glycosyltransferase [Bacteroidales bacterium]